jgi:uncharacterized protein (TIGR04255 family)
MSSLRLEKPKREIPLLLYPPLIETIFELHWELQGDKQTGRLRDPSYPMMYGRLYERLKNHFPHTEDLPSVQVHPEASPYVVRHRVRKEKMGYPLYQIGPGIATLNYAQDYSWSSFREHILLLVEAIYDLFPTEITPLNFTKCEIRFLNGIRMDVQNDHPLEFLSDKLHMKVEMDSDLFLMNQLNDQPNTVNFTVGYPLKKLNGNLGITAHLGQMDGKQAYLLQTQVVSGEEGTPGDPEGFASWIDIAHDAAVHSFITLCKGSLMNQFCGG